MLFLVEFRRVLSFIQVGMLDVHRVLRGVNLAIIVVQGHLCENGWVTQHRCWVESHMLLDQVSSVIEELLYLTDHVRLDTLNDE